jgi:hypothetical protein
VPSVAPNPLLVERVKGNSLRQIGARHGLHHESVRRVVLAEGSQIVREMEAELDGPDGWVSVLIPYGQQQVDWQDSLLLLDFCARRLQERGRHIRIETRRHPAGAFLVLLEGAR